MSEAASFKVDIRPDVSALRMFKSLSFTPWFAIGEFVDNSITSALKNYQRLREVNGPDYVLTVTIEFRPNENSLVIEDNAAGIAERDIARSLRTGAPPDDVSIGLSRHGVGMKAAALWWGETLTVDTFPIDEETGWHTVIDISETKYLDNLTEVTAVPHRGYPGTRITVSGLDKKLPQTKTVSAIKAYLRSIYRSYIGSEVDQKYFRCVLIYDGTPLTLEVPQLLEAPFWASKYHPTSDVPSQYWKLDVSIPLSSGIVITGWVGILAQMSRDLSGFFLHYRGKGIAGVVPISTDVSEDMSEAKDAINRAAYKPRKIFKQSGGYPDQSFIGEFDITGFGKSITTDSPLWGPAEEQEFSEKLFELMTDENMNFLKMAGNYQRRKASKHDALEAKKSDALEGALFAQAFDHQVDHSSPRIDHSDSQERILIDPVPAHHDEDSENLHFSFNDREQHTHDFTLTIIKDRSQEFLIIRENPEKRSHEIQINFLHPALDEVDIDINVRKALQKFAAGMAVAEVMLTGWDKQQLRVKMNQILRTLGGARHG